MIIPELVARLTLPNGEVVIVSHRDDLPEGGSLVVAVNKVLRKHGVGPERRAKYELITRFKDDQKAGTVAANHS